MKHGYLKLKSETRKIKHEYTYTNNKLDVEMMKPRK